MTEDCGGGAALGRTGSVTEPVQVDGLDSVWRQPTVKYIRRSRSDHPFGTQQTITIRGIVSGFQLIPRTGSS